jgi:hypothetical protein
MASFKDIKNLLKKDDEMVIENKNLPQLELEEAVFLLNLIARSDFKGQDIQAVYNSVLKLQETIKILNT